MEPGGLMDDTISHQQLHPNYELVEIRQENLCRDLGMLLEWEVMSEEEAKDLWDRMFPS